MSHREQTKNITHSIAPIGALVVLPVLLLSSYFEDRFNLINIILIAQVIILLIAVTIYSRASINSHLAHILEYVFAGESVLGLLFTLQYLLSNRIKDIITLQLPPLTLATSISITLIGGFSFYFISGRHVKLPREVPKFIPFAVAVLLSTMTCFFWKNQSINQNKNLKTASEQNLKSLSDDIHYKIYSESVLISRLIKQLPVINPSSIRTIIGQSALPINEIYWVPLDGEVRALKNKKIVNAEINKEFYTNYKNLNFLSQQPSGYLTNIRLTQTESGFSILYGNENLVAFDYSFETIWNELKDNFSKNFFEFEIKDSFKKTIIGKSSGFDSTLRSDWSAVSELEIYDFKLTLTTHPALSVMRSLRNRSPDVILLSGIFIAIALALAIQYSREMSEENRARRQAENALKLASDAKSRFVADISHEIRTPLNAILGRTELLLEGRHLTEEARNHLNIVKKAGDGLLYLVNDLLDLSKIESGRFSLVEKPYSLTSLLTEVHDLFKTKFLEKSIEFKIRSNISSENEWQYGDGYRLKQVIINLVSNAFKFTNQGYVEIGTELDSNNTLNPVSIYVKDTGRGLKSEELEKVFNRFIQAEKTIQIKYGGTGLGLALSKNLITQMGGKIEVQSKYNIGSLFKVCLPLKSVKISHIEDEVSRSLTIDIKPRKKNLNLLIVDDNEDNQDLIKAYLKNHHFQVTYAGDGSQAIQSYMKAQNEKAFDIIFMDLQMPVLDGFQAIQEIRKFDTKTPIIAFTAFSLEQDLNRATQCGATDILLKPVKKSTLLEMIQKYSIEKKIEIKAAA